MLVDYLPNNSLELITIKMYFSMLEVVASKIFYMPTDFFFYCLNPLGIVAGVLQYFFCCQKK